ncbi:C1 family peptidase [Candidatus Finniella inopinata]|uniref:Peptidase C1A papain C-terminal domain-containing protein n=1 Tax=Candidatus Finniella inopinata TaxID=1696036 RepID=A0A4Q7DNR5_9PROT|nr:C1 family peptidase [Candidatus Finniella inopinata]RZI46556.1 hypothetical protein EQU50_02920 [Candidatus Finniella inopinata]
MGLNKMVQILNFNSKLKALAVLILLTIYSQSSFASSAADVSSDLDQSKSAHPSQRKYKLIRDSETHHASRDFMRGHPVAAHGHALLAKFGKTHPAALPKAHDIRLSLAKTIDAANALFPVYDQGNLGSGAANASAAALQFKGLQEKFDKATPSRLFIYYNERANDSTLDVTQDSGASIADSLAAITRFGACPESEWKYSDDTTSSNPLFTQKPSAKCYADALKDADTDSTATAGIPQNSNTLHLFKTILNHNNPILLGLNLYESFKSDDVAQSGMVPMPNTTSEQLKGGHALMVTGYNDATQRITIRNSWGSSWGDKGYCYVPYDYITNADLASDFWFVSKVGAKKAASASSSSHQ